MSCGNQLRLCCVSKLISGKFINNVEVLCINRVCLYNYVGPLNFYEEIICNIKLKMNPQTK